MEFMPLVGQVGRKRARARIAMLILYLVLSLGALTTIYPFFVMMTTGFKGTFDQNDNKLIPKFWSDNDELFVKYRDDKYSGNIVMQESYGGEAELSPDEFKQYEDFLESLPAEQWLAGFTTPANNVTSRMNKKWQAWLKEKYSSVDEINAAFNEINGAIQQVVPPPENLTDSEWTPKYDQKWSDWIEFKNQLPAEWRIPITSTYLFQQYARTKTSNQFGDVPAEIKAEATNFEALKLPATGEWYEEFKAQSIPAAFNQSGTVEEQWAKVSNKEFGIKSYEKAYANEHEKEIRSEFTSRNYQYVMDYMVVNGKALLNTIIFVGLAILTQLTVNPLAAYALSRFPMKNTAKILIFLLATMAFPAEVAMIPSFLLLKDLGLLNTFAALVLPSAASGYMIFLLKGFFDSLPQEVFESGQIDGSPEWLMMLKIAFPLSKPVLGYMALLAFMGAYGAFLYAFLVAQDREMWTVMVFVYQLQTISPKSVVLAATTLVAIPTLIVFLMAQRVIMRGIVLPGER